jgi:hypothetical protein
MKMTLCVYDKVGETAKRLDIGHQIIVRPIGAKKFEPLCFTARAASDLELVVSMLHSFWKRGLKAHNLRSLRKRTTYRPYVQLAGNVWVGTPEEALTQMLNGW